MAIFKNGHHRGKQQYRCNRCGHQYVKVKAKTRSIETLYFQYCLGKQTLVELSKKTGNCTRTLQRQFDALIIEPFNSRLFNEPVNLIVDATFFSRSDGVLVFRAQKINLYWRFIESESLAELSAGLDELDSKGYHWKSVTLDGRRGMIQLFQERYPSVPIQLCQFHQAQIIKRYTTNNPKTPCGRELKQLMAQLTQLGQEEFSSRLIALRGLYGDFLKERNDQGQFKHRRLRSAFRSLKTNLPYLFTCKNHPELTIPNTTNSCDGSFAHWKQKVKIHRGLRKERRNKMINFLLKHQKKP